MKLTASCLVVAALAMFASHASAQVITRESVTSSQGQASAGAAAPSASRSGRFVVFTSTASNLPGGSVGAYPLVYLHDHQTGGTYLCGSGAGGAAPNSTCSHPSVSDDGRFVVFSSEATNLTFNDSNGSSDVFLFDRLTGLTSCLSRTSGGLLGNGPSHSPVISADGTTVAFECYAPNITLSSWGQIVVAESSGGQILLASSTPLGAPGNLYSYDPSISGDGRYVAFSSSSSDLLPGDSNGVLDVFVRDVMSSATWSPTMDPNWVIGNSYSQHGSITDDGRYVAFDSTASNFVLGDVNSASDVFVYDSVTRLYTMVSSGPGYSGASKIAADGSTVAFSTLNPIDPNDVNAKVDVYAANLTLNTVTRLVPTGIEPNDNSECAGISADGSRVIFTSVASNLVAGDTNGAQDIFMSDTGVQCSGLPHFCTAKTNSQGCVPEICAENLPSMSGPDDFNVTAHGVLNNKTGILLWSLAQGSHPLGGGTLCLGSPIIRTPAQNSGGTPTGNDCTGLYSFSFSQAYMAAHGLSAGSVVYAQYWSRDPFIAPPNNIGLTDGLEFTVGP